MFKYGRTLKGKDINDPTKERKVKIEMLIPSNGIRATFKIDGRPVDRWVFQIFLQMASIPHNLSELDSAGELPPTTEREPGRDQPAVQPEPTERDDGPGGP